MPPENGTTRREELLAVATRLFAARGYHGTRMDDVADVVVRGVADLEWGQRVVAWVVPAGEPPTLDGLRATVKQSLPPHCAPRELRLLPAIPRTALGKPDVPALLAIPAG